MEDYSIKKYPRTPHLEGSRLQVGDEDLSQIPFSDIQGKHVIIEEKIDGANTAISFDGDGHLLLQSRGHYLTGGYREKHYNLMKTWASMHQQSFYDVLGSRYIMYGEWMYAKHKIYYDALPHYFMEFDIYDRLEQRFLDTPARHQLIHTLPICSVPVLGEGFFQRKEDVLAFLGPSLYKTEDCYPKLIQTLQSLNLNERDINTILKETDSSPLMEGLYFKIEEKGSVVKRLKYVRASFVQGIQESEIAWLDRPIIPNGLKEPLENIYLP